jgi:hypothetical protein
MADPQNRKRIAQEFLNFGPKASNAGLSFLKAQQHKEQIDEVDRVAREKVLKEKLAQAKIEGAILAASDPHMSVEAQIIALKNKVGLSVDDPNYQKIIDAANTGFELRMGEVQLSRYNAEQKNNAPNIAKEIHQQYLGALKGKSTPQGEVIEEPFTGSLVEYAAQQLEETRVTALDALVGNNPIFTTILSAPGKRLNYDSIAGEIAKIQGTLDHQNLLSVSLGSSTDEISKIIIQGDQDGTEHSGHKPLLSGQSLKYLTDTLKQKGLSYEEVNKIVTISILSGLEVQVEKNGTDLLDTNYFDNIIDLLHYKDGDSKNGISQYEKDRPAGEKIINKIREYKKNLIADFDRDIGKTSKSNEEKLVIAATTQLSSMMSLATQLDENGMKPTKGAISMVIDSFFQQRGPGESLEGIKYMDSTVRSAFLTRFNKLLDNADEDVKKDLSEQEVEFRGEIAKGVSDHLSVINSDPFERLSIDSAPSHFETERENLNVAQAGIRKLYTDATSKLGYKWEGSTEFYNRIRKGLDDIGKARKVISGIEESASTANTLRGLSIQLENETNTYDNKIVSILKRDEPRLSTLMKDMKLLSSTDPEDVKLYNQKHAEVESILEQVLTKPSYNKVNGRIMNNDAFVFNDVSRRSIRNDLSAIGLARAKVTSDTKIIINPAGSRDFRAKISRSLTALGVNSQASTFDEQIKKIQGMQIETTNAFEQNRISGSTYTTMRKELKSALTNLDGLVNKNYGSIKIFDDSKDKLAMKLTGYSTEGIKINIINSSHKVIFGVFEQEHEALQNHLVDVSDTFTLKKIIPAVGTKEERKITQEGMFMSGVSYHNKRIRELAFTKHRNKMTGADTTESILKYAEIMEKSGKWSEEEIQIIEEVANFESIPGVTAYLIKGYKDINTAGDNSFAQGYATRDLGEQKKLKKPKVDVKEESSLMKEFFKNTTIKTTGTDINTSSNDKLLVPDMETTEDSVLNINLQPPVTAPSEDVNINSGSLLAPVETN